MRRPRIVARVVTAAAGAALVISLPAAARAAGPQAPPANPATSPVVVERVENTGIFALDSKYTGFNGIDGFLLGGYGGILLDDALFLGGAGYWMVNGDSLRELGYGGVLVEWHVLRSQAASVSVGGLGGFGVARVAHDENYDGYRNPLRPTPKHGGSYHGYGGYWNYDRGFLVGEPQVSAVFRIADGASIAASAGYRFAAFADGWEDQISGLTAGVSIRFGSRR